MSLKGNHGVGPMREYCISAILLDFQNPLKIIGHLKEPLLQSTAEPANGYVTQCDVLLRSVSQR